jgi:ABC-type uncharacterized transport system ATPase subunit
VIKVEPSSAAVKTVMDGMTHGRALPSANGALYYEVPANTALPGLLRELVNADAITRFEAIEPSLQEIYIQTIEGDKA